GGYRRRRRAGRTWLVDADVFPIDEVEDSAHDYRWRSSDARRERARGVGFPLAATRSKTARTSSGGAPLTRAVSVRAAPDSRPPRVPLARVNQVLFGVKRRGGVSGCLSARESPEPPREHL